jgi:hypothetical protein
MQKVIQCLAVLAILAVIGKILWPLFTFASAVLTIGWPVAALFVAIAFLLGSTGARRNQTED